MNRQECDVLNTLLSRPYENQRVTAQLCEHSLGIVNCSLKALFNDGYIDEHARPTAKAVAEVLEKSPKNAIILAAGLGMRMVPINTETPKGLIEVDKEPLIERIIKQLREVGVSKIYVVVGFMKEQYEYLIDKFDAELIVNSDYATKNNLHSMNLVLDRLSNTYVIPCDIWCRENPFNRRELYSWYMVGDKTCAGSPIRINRKLELVNVPASVHGNKMIGISYLLEEQAVLVREEIRQMCGDARYDSRFWEEALYQQNRMIVQAKVVDSDDAVEINTFEQLRELDGNSRHLNSDVISVIAKALKSEPADVTDIEVLKKGMTNRSFLFQCKGKKYIMRIPGEGTDRLINRKEEAVVYHMIAGRGICDDIAYIDPQSGYKITEFLENARVCDPSSSDDVKKCMKKLREFHALGMQVDHEFDIFRQIEFYETLWNGQPSAYREYAKTKANVLSLKSYIDTHAEKKTLTHIDAVPDNFLFVKNECGEESIRLIDWEYAAMQDPHVDIAMFCIYSMYDRQQVDNLIRAYFGEDGPSDATRIKIYCYIAACGLLWSNWCEYKRCFGIEFGEYSLRQYRYAKDYYAAVQDEIKKQTITNIVEGY
ncbi:MAG: NTP transferase domain-containing protein [Oscillospiraceae bacterium]